MNNIGDVMANMHSLDIGRLILTRRDGEALMCFAPPPRSPNQDVGTRETLKGRRTAAIVFGSNG